MTKAELIKALQDLPCDDDTPVLIYDYKKNRDGEPDEGIYQIEVDLIHHEKQLSPDELELYMEQVENAWIKPWIALCLDNPDLQD